MKLKFGVHWFRQDLRLVNNPSLEVLAKRVDQIIPIYIIEPLVSNQYFGFSPLHPKSTKKISLF